MSKVPDPGALRAWRPPPVDSPQKYVRLDLRVAELVGSLLRLLTESELTRHIGAPGQGAGSAPSGRQACPKAAGAGSKSRAALSTAAKRSERADRRKTRGAPALAGGPTAAERQSVSAATRASYETAWMAFSSWARHHRLPMAPAPALDDTLVSYLDQALFLAGDPMTTARAALFGTTFWQGLPKSSTTLPRARRALKGFARDEPPMSRDPMPLEAAALMTQRLFQSSDLIDNLAGVAFLCS